MHLRVVGAAAAAVVVLTLVSQAGGQEVLEATPTNDAAGVADLAATVAVLQATVAAHTTIDHALLEARVAALETQAAVPGGTVPEQTSHLVFMQTQPEELRVRVDVLEASSGVGQGTTPAPLPTTAPTPTPSPWSTGREGLPAQHGSLSVLLDAVYQPAPPGLPAPPPGGTYLILTLDLRARQADATYRADRFRAETAAGTPLVSVALDPRIALPAEGVVTRFGAPVRGRLAFLVPPGTGAVTVRFLEAEGEDAIVWDLPGPESATSGP